MEDLTGQVFGTLEVTGYNESESIIRSQRYHHAKHCWNVKCIICGHETVKPSNDLKRIAKNGTCGCKECNRIDLTGQRFGRLLVKGLAPEEKQEWGKQIWECLCDCGEITYCTTGRLNAKDGTKSCGCLAKEASSRNISKNHIWNGDSQNPKYVKLFRTWYNMNNRCFNEHADDYYLYGERGITVCDEWHTNWFAFKNWALSHGYTDELSIDRIDVNGNYEPDNCRWATDIEQANNTRVNKYLTYHGETDTLANWCRKLRLNYSRTKARLNTCGYSVEDAFEKKRYELRT